MNNLSINTSQNVQINYNLASIGDRILAFIIDSIIKIGYTIIIFLIFAFLTESFGDFNVENSSAGILFVLGFLFFFPIIFYDLICEQLMQGQSFGKRALKIKVVKNDGSQPSFGAYFMRWLLRIIDGLFSWGVGICSILLTDNSQRLGDLAANTVVIKLSKKVNLEDMVFFDVDESHQTKYQKVLKLNDREIELIRSILNRPFTDEKPAIINELATKIRTVIEEEKDELNDNDFLKQVLSDYNYLSVRM